MTTRRFAPLFWCQFFSAFGDNFLKIALVFVILFQIAGADSEALITLAGATLIAPFFFLSGLGGELADRYDKALVAQRLKFAEIGVAALAVAGFAFHSLVLLFIAVFLFGVIASLFGPIKYGILPDHLARAELPSGNALVEGGTFLAILLGTIVAGLAAKNGGDPIHFAWLMMVSALACWVASRFIPPTGEGAPHLTINRNIFVSTGTLIKYIRGEPRLWWGALVASWFWLVGALVLSLLPPLVTFDIGGTAGVVTLFLTIFSVAVAVGSGLAAGSRPGVSFSCRRSSAPCCSACSASILAGRIRLSYRRHIRSESAIISLRLTAFTLRSISPAWRSPAACSSCRRLPRCRPGPAPTTARASSPPSTSSMPPSWSLALCCSPCCKSSASACRSCLRFSASPTLSSPSSSVAPCRQAG
jgi:MFS family permease